MDIQQVTETGKLTVGQIVLVLESDKDDHIRKLNAAMLSGDEETIRYHRIVYNYIAGTLEWINQNDY